MYIYIRIIYISYIYIYIYIWTWELMPLNLIVLLNQTLLNLDS